MCFRCVSWNQMSAFCNDFDVANGFFAVRGAFACFFPCWGPTWGTAGLIWDLVGPHVHRMFHHHGRQRNLAVPRTRQNRPKNTFWPSWGLAGLCLWRWFVGCSWGRLKGYNGLIGTFRVMFFWSQGGTLAENFFV